MKKYRVELDTPRAVLLTIAICLEFLTSLPTIEQQWNVMLDFIGNCLITSAMMALLRPGASWLIDLNTLPYARED